MSDPIAQAAEAMNAAPMPDPQTASIPASIEAVLNVGVAPVAGNVLVNATPTVESPNVAPAVIAGAPEAGAAPAAGGDLPRESHLMLLEHKLAGFRAKLVNAERISLDEFESIVGHMRAVL